MFTKKPEQEVGGDPLRKMSDRQVSETTPFGERPPSYAKTSVPSKLVPSIIGEDLMITGNVTSKGEIQVDGEIQGDVQCGSLLLGDKSQITGCVLADDVVVRGRVIGSIRGLRVTLQAQSHVEGDIRASPLSRVRISKGNRAVRTIHWRSSKLTSLPPLPTRSRRHLMLRHAPQNSRIASK